MAGEFDIFLKKKLICYNGKSEHWVRSPTEKVNDFCDFSMALVNIFHAK